MANKSRLTDTAATALYYASCSWSGMCPSLRLLIGASAQRWSAAERLLSTFGISFDKLRAALAVTASESRVDASNILNAIMERALTKASQSGTSSQNGKVRWVDTAHIVISISELECAGAAALHALGLASEDLIAAENTVEQLHLVDDTLVADDLRPSWLRSFFRPSKPFSRASEFLL